MGLAPGGRMRQRIHEDPHDLRDWDVARTQRVFVTLVHAHDWKAVTGEAAPDHPPSAEDYARAGLPWFEHHGADRGTLAGSATLAGLDPVAKRHQEKTGAALPGSAGVATPKPVRLGTGPRRVSTGRDW